MQAAQTTQQTAAAKDTAHATTGLAAAAATKGSEVDERIKRITKQRQISINVLYLNAIIQTEQSLQKKLLKN